MDFVRQQWRENVRSRRCAERTLPFLVAPGAALAFVRQQRRKSEL
jgi:hypothetical protein